MNRWLNIFANSRAFQKALSYFGMGHLNAKIMAIVFLSLSLSLTAGIGILLAQNSGRGTGRGGASSGSTGGSSGPHNPGQNDFFSGSHFPGSGGYFNNENFRGGNNNGDSPFYSPGGSFSLGGGSGGGNTTIIQSFQSTPISTPEPISSTLFLLGGAAFAMRSLRNRKKN